MDQNIYMNEEKKIQHFRNAPTEEPPSQKRKWILVAGICFGVLCMIIASLLTGLKLVLEERNRQLTEERDRLNQTLLNIDHGTYEGWLYFGRSLYLGSTTEQSWQESRRYCQERGADLIIINTEQEQNFARLTFPEPRWIGLSDIDQEGEWKWVDGSLLTISFWSPDEPNSAGGVEDCVELIKSRNGSRIWNDNICATKQKCICEKPVA